MPVRLGLCYLMIVVKETFFFYDVETSGLDPKTMRIMQFAGQRTDLNLQPIGQPVNWLVRLSDDVLPDPEAVLLTGITPQQTRQEGVSEADFCKMLYQQVLTPGTIVTGFNNLRFDDNFLRYTLYRNLYDPYEWSWSENRSRWDLLDAVRLTRAVRPDGINWPLDDEGLPTNRLEALARANGLDHASAHDAMSDVAALIGLARLLKDKQPKLFDYLLNMRHKKRVAELVNPQQPQPFVYASGRYDASWLKTTIAYPIAAGTNPSGVLVWDLRQNPEDYLKLTESQISKMFDWQDAKAQLDGPPVPIKELCLNRCPAVAPVGVLDPTSRERLGLDLTKVESNLRALRHNRALLTNFAKAFAGRPARVSESDVDGQLYDGFLDDADRRLLPLARQADPDELSAIGAKFKDRRMTQLLLRYKARNFENRLNDDERAAWEAYRAQRLKADLPAFGQKLQALAAQPSDDRQRFLIEELKLWAESILPAA